ncbi:MAG: ABC transporter ATP-binding protein [Candidatus Marinimicrobia bacterium]|nr:ABC transporter ATP-binding protein [Candidatus Neomarinimicrobiota bacterium]
MSEVILRIENLTKSFKDRKVVDSLNLEVTEGEVFGFLGPNGAGKSTTIRLILSLIKPDSGDVKIFGKWVTKHRNGSLQNVGALIEEAAFYKNLTARRNLQILVNLGGGTNRRIDEVLEIVRLIDRADDKVKTYSHGMKQRLGIAQALLHNPKLMILDEPTSGLDPHGIKEVRELIKSMSDDGITVFLSSHLLHEVEQSCSTMAIINEGRLVVSGKVKDLLKQTDLFTTEIQAQPIEEAVSVIRQLDFVKIVVVSEESIKVSVSKDDLPNLTTVLVEKGIKVSAIVPRSSLEDFFLSLTVRDDG